MWGWDLNRAEKRAVAASVFLVGLAGLSRVAWSPGAGVLAWRPVDATASAIGAPTDSVAAALAREARAQKPLAPGEKIDIASAPSEELRRLSGVGPSLAGAIIRERAARPFRSVEDLDRVPGVGPATFDRLREHVTVASAPFPLATGARPSRCGADLVDLNSADAPDLEELPGVGPKLAERILALRRERGGFGDSSELDDVAGIGAVSFARLAPLVCAG